MTVAVRPRRRLALPAFLAEIEGPEYRSRLEFSVRSGLSIVLVFALWGMASGAIPPDMFFYWPVGLKIASNTAAWIGLRTNRLVLLTASVNVNNLLNAQYYDYAIASATTVGRFSAYPLPGRTYMVKAGATF